MLNRRTFCRQAAATLAGALVAGTGVGAAAMQSGSGRRRQVTVGGRRVKTIDVHSHCVVPGIMEMMGQKTPANPSLVMGTGRLPQMDEQGIDVEVLSINPFWYSVGDRELARSLIAAQNEKLAAFCSANAARFAGLATVALQHPDLAAEQLEAGMKMGLRGVSIGASVDGEELAAPRFDPFWAKAEALRAPIFIHPQGVPDLKRLQGNGLLTNVIGNPLDTTIALSHLIFEGTLDKFPGLQDLRRARRRLPAVLCRPVRSRLPHLSRAVQRQDQEAADRIPEAALRRLAGVHRRGAAASHRRLRREPDRARHRLSVPVDVDRGRSRPRGELAERRGQGRDPRRQRRRAAEYRGLTCFWYGASGSQPLVDGRAASTSVISASRPQASNAAASRSRAWPSDTSM